MSFVSSARSASRQANNAASVLVPRWLLGLSALLALFALLAAPAQAAPLPTGGCGLTIEIIAAPFAVVDSNKPGLEGPRVGMLSARVSNTGGVPISTPRVAIGDGTTPGVFSAVGGARLALLQPDDAAHQLVTLAPGASVTAFWPVTYPATFNVAYPYTVWATATGGCSASAASQITTQSEISATANKLQPLGGVTIVSPSVVAPGGLLTVKVIGFTLGTIGQGPQPAAPYDAWLQPVGNPDFDPTCLRLVRSEVNIRTISGAPLVDRLYFPGLTGYRADPADSVAYTFVALRACTTVLQPYQEAASGTQEKYNGDFSASTSRIALSSAANTALQLQAAVSPTTVGAGGTLTYSLGVSALSGTVGYPENGSPVVVTAPIALGTSYVAGSATSSAAASVEYSVVGSAAWSTTAPADPATVDAVRWLLSEPVGTSSATMSFATTAISTGSALTTTISAGLLNAEPLAVQLMVANGVQPTPTPTATAEPVQSFSVQSAETGGLESEPLAGAPSAFLDDPAGQAARPTPTPAPEGLVASIGEPAASGGPSRGRSSRPFRATSSNPLLNIGDMLPGGALPGTTGVPATPGDVLAVTEAPDARAINYVDAQGRVSAVALGILTLGAPYEHDYGVCNRFKAADFDTIAPEALAGLPGAPGPEAFWHGRAAFEDSRHEDAFVFHVFVDEVGKRFHIDSRWVQDAYPADMGFAFDYVFNMQVWSVDAPTSEQVLRAILARLSQQGGWQLVYHNGSAAAPQVFIRGVQYSADRVRLTLQNLTTAEQVVAIHGTWRTQMERTVNQPVALSLPIPPGRSAITFAFPGLLDTILFAEHGGFSDKIYTGGGLWFTFASPMADAALTTGQCRSIDAINPQDLLLAGCNDFVGSAITQPDEIGLGRTLNPNGRPVDVSAFRAVRFWARGDGQPTRLTLETAGIADHDYYQTVFTADAEWREYSVPLSSFRQRGFGAAQPLTATDVKALVWTNADATSGSFALSVDQVVFTDDGMLRITDAPSATADTAPQAVRATATDPAAVQAAQLWYSLDDGATWTATAMERDGATSDFVGSVPAQPLGSDVRYYVMSTDTRGAVSRTPVDAPAVFERYRVDDRPSLLVDDFAAGRLRNRLDGGAGLFNSASSGGRLRAYQRDQQLMLDYDVTQSGQLAGYATDLGSLDVRGYTTLDLLIRGERGGEQLELGLGDASGFQPRRRIGALASGGVSAEWHWVQVPLAAFPAALDRGALRTLLLTFDHAGGATAGRVYLRELRLTALPSPLVVDTFDAGDPLRNSLALGHWTSGGAIGAAEVAGDAQHTTGRAMQLDYSVNPGGYAVWGSQLGGVHVAPAAVLSFWVRGADQALLPYIYLGDGPRRARVPLGDYVTPDASWQRVQIPVAAWAAQGVDLTQLRTFELAWELGSGAGQLWIDNLSLGVPGSVQAGRRVVVLRDGAPTPVALHTSDGGSWSARSAQGWLVVAGTGAGPESLQVGARSWMLLPGSYRGSVTLTAEGGASEQLLVNLRVSTATPTAHSWLPLLGRH